MREFPSRPQSSARISAPDPAAGYRSPRNRRSLNLPVAILVILLGLFFWGQSIRPLTDTSEGRYAEVAREMIASGDWLVPTLDGYPHLTKPPLATWFTAGSMMLFGQNEFAVRLPGWIALLFTAVLVGRIAVYLDRPAASRWAAFIFALSLGPLVASTFPTTDTILTLFEIAAVAAYLAQRRGSRGARWWFFASLGAAFLTKGPPGLLVPVAVIIGDRLLRRRPPRESLASPGGTLAGFWPGWILFAIIGLGWYLLLVLRHPGLLSFWLRDETVYRVFSDRHHRSSPPPLPTLALLGGLLPWWPLLIRLVRHEWRRFPSRWRTGSRPVLLAWIVLPLAVFTLSQSRLALYALPLVPGAALALAFDRPRSWNAAPGRWFGLHRGWVLAYAVFLAVLSWGSVPVAENESWKSEADWLREELPPGETELAAFRLESANSLQFYLGTTVEILSDGRAESDPRFDSLAEETRQMRTTPEGRASHLFVVRGAEEREIVEALVPAPTHIRKVGRYDLWLQEPLVPPSPADTSGAPDRPTFVRFGRTGAVQAGE